MQIDNSHDYVAWTQTTAIYMNSPYLPPEKKEMYPFLGALDELGELAGLFKRELRDGVPVGRKELMLELGDLAWYLARIHYDHTENVEEGSKLDCVIKAFNLPEDIAKGTCFDVAFKIMEHVKPFILSKAAAMDYVIGTGVFTANPATFVKEVIEGLEIGIAKVETKEDVRFIMSMTQRVVETEVLGLLMHMAGELHSSDGLLSFFALCYQQKFDMMDILRANVEKLESRKERGTLSGKGSER